MKKTVQLAFFAFLFSLFIAHSAVAQGGCDDSPENPTLILAALAGGVYGANTFRTRLRASRAAKNQ